MNIDIIKAIHEIHEKKKNEIELNKQCYICTNGFTCTNENKYKTLCNDCYKKHCLPFRGKVTAAEMAEIIKQAKKMREATLNNDLHNDESDDTVTQE